MTLNASGKGVLIRTSCDECQGKSTSLLPRNGKKGKRIPKELRPSVGAVSPSPFPKKKVRGGRAQGSNGSNGPFALTWTVQRREDSEK